MTKKLNLIQKILLKYTDKPVNSGDFISLKPHHIMTHDNTAAVLAKYTSLKKRVPALKIALPQQPVFTCDHNIQDKSPQNLAKYEKIKRFAQDNGIDFYGPGRGIGHQIMVEQGYAFPQTVVVASDSHSNMYGGIGCLGTPVVRTDACSVWSTSSTWWKVPPIVKVNLRGSLPIGITGKDLIIALCSAFNKDEVLNCAIEFTGTKEALDSISIEDRLAISNMTTEWAALAGIFAVDDKTLNWIERRVKKYEKEYEKGGKFLDSYTVPTLKDAHGIHPRYNRETLQNLKENLLQADEGAFYSKELTFDLSSLKQSIVCGPNSVKISNPISELEKKKIRIHKAYIVSCVNSRLSDLKAAANVVRNLSSNDLPKVAEGVELYIAAASREVQKDSEAEGDWDVLIKAGAKPLPSGCGPCIGLGVGLLEDDEVGISATNRNFKGRMGSRSAQVYLASPEVVIASSLKGYISGANEMSGSNELKYDIKINRQYGAVANYPAELIEGFPEKISGEIILCPQDGLNTDGIYPGKYTYREDLTKEEMAKVAMENYDPAFSSLVKKGDILVSGSNFGSGSSREQATTALKFAGIQLVVAKSFSETYTRNALNNGLLCIQCPELVNDLQNLVSKTQNRLTYRTECNLQLFPGNGVIKASFSNNEVKTYHTSVVGKIAQELISCGGLESWIEKKASS